MAGDFIPNEFVGLFMWPSMDNVRAFMDEIDPTELNSRRKAIWSELKQHMVIVPSDIALTFKEDKVYEVKMVWTDSTFDAGSVSKNGGKIMLNAPVTGYEDLGGNKSPNQFLIVEWDNKKSADSFRKKRSLDMEKEEAFYTSFSFPKE